jgi:SWI/SNF-related matrix-associated actin-dependent regulator of chromatin subfamily A3
MPRQRKRPREVVDLTQESGETHQGARPAKSPRLPSSSSFSSQVSVPGSSQSSSIAYSHAPSSSAPALPSYHDASERLSWQTPANDDDEPSTQSLTQNDDGPQLELYGSFGTDAFILCPRRAETDDGSRRQDCRCKVLHRHGHRWRGGCLSEGAGKSCKPVRVPAQRPSARKRANFWIPQYDSNAIRVDNVLGNQIGHIPRAVAEKLAPYLVSHACEI